MQIKLFNIPLSDEGERLAEMNRFLTSSKILEVEQRFFQNEKGGCWSFCVRYLNSGYTGAGPKEKVDYKQVLSEEEFSRFSRLREIRKSLAAEDAVPAYAVFTDEELAGIARLSSITPSSLTTVNGIGEKKVAKYGQQLIGLYNSTPQNG